VHSTVMIRRTPFLLAITTGDRVNLHAIDHYDISGAF
jgi:hypothetical protein